MGIGVSLFSLALGAILTFALDVRVSGLDIDAVGVILMIVGAVGLIVSMLFWSSFAPFGASRRRTVVQDRDVDVI